MVQNNPIAQYVKRIVRLETELADRDFESLLYERLEKAFSLLPEEVLGLFLKGSRTLVVEVMADTQLPLGMATKSKGAVRKRQYVVVTYPEHAEWSENRFIGAFLRELGHVVAQRPPEEEWPVSRGDRARFKERLEYQADAMVWRWGLRHYSMSFLSATYPPHWVERIVEEIGKTMLEEEPVH
jgi:hypothetical protein